MVFLISTWEILAFIHFFFSNKHIFEKDILCITIKIQKFENQDEAIYKIAFHTYSYW